MATMNVSRPEPMKEWVERQVIIEQPLDAELQQKVLNICQKTPVTKTLLRSMEIRTEFG